MSKDIATKADRNSKIREKILLIHTRILEYFAFCDKSSMGNVENENSYLEGVMDELKLFINEAMPKRPEELERDILRLVLRLMAEPIGSFAPESAEVMERWIPKAREVLEGRREL